MAQIIHRQATPTTSHVDQGIELLQILDRDLVAEFLLRRGVRFPVIVRVVSAALPAPRRRQLAGRGVTAASTWLHIEVELHWEEAVRAQLLPQAVDPVTRLCQQRDQTQLAINVFHSFTTP